MLQNNTEKLCFDAITLLSLMFSLAIFVEAIPQQIVRSAVAIFSMEIT